MNGRKPNRRVSKTEDIADAPISYRLSEAQERFLLSDTAEQAEFKMPSRIQKPMIKSVNPEIEG